MNNLDWRPSTAFQVGDEITMTVPRRDLWARILRLFGINRTKVQVYRCVGVRHGAEG